VIERTCRNTCSFTAGPTVAWLANEHDDPVLAEGAALLITES
jgi:hypothetical protein